MRLDRIDLKILAVLQAEGRITKKDLADRVALSPSACFDRMQRLEKAGYVNGYHADINLSKLLATSVVFVEITLENHRASDFARFERAVQDIPEVLECYALGGGIDYIVKFLTRSIDHYQQTIDAMLESDIGIDKYFTYFMTKPVKLAQPPLHYLLEEDV